MCNENLYMRINYGTMDGNVMPNKRSFIGKQKENTSKYLLAGGVYSKNGATVMFKANSAEEARNFAQNNTMMNKRLQELKRDVIILPKYICEEQ